MITEISSLHKSQFYLSQVMKKQNAGKCSLLKPIKRLKLVRTPLNVYFTAFKSIFLSLSLYAPITSYECHAWFHLNAASPSARNTEQVNITKKFLSTVGFEPPTLHLLISSVSPLTTPLLGQLTIWDYNFYSTYLLSDTIKTLCRVQWDIQKMKIKY